MNFASDNNAGVAPEVMAALAAAAAAPPAPAYGADAWTERAEAALRAAFDAPDARVFLVATGTAANALALACLTPPWATIYCHEAAHIRMDECGAPLFYAGGATLTPLPGAQGRVDSQALDQALEEGRAASVHQVQPGALSLTQATEWGGVYRADQIGALAAAAHRAGLPVHMDGTRFANALARANARPAELSWQAGVDVLCLGATKCGAMAAEAVILFDPGRAREFELRRKRGGHLLSKMRLVAAQIEAWLDGGTWLRLAGHANAMADRLAAGLAAAGAEIVAPVEANLVFARLPAETHARVKAAGARFYDWEKLAPPDGAPRLIRLVCSHETSPEEVDRLADLVAG